MGVRRAGIRRQFVAEGCILGVIGATIGLAVAVVVAAIVNRSGMMWTPPGQAGAIPLQLLLSGETGLMAGGWFGLTVVATVAALIPANRAARMAVVDALRHV
jgi:putative ABC transport system permease protein